MDEPMNDLNNLLSTMGEPAASTSADEPPQSDPAPAPASAEPAPASAEPEETPEDIFRQLPKNKQNEAFARMRTENKSMGGLLKDLGKTIGITDVENLDVLTSQIRDRLIKLQAEQQQVNPAVLQEQYRQSQELTAAQAAMLETQATLGLQKVKDTYGLTQGQLTEFAKALVNEGKNPFTHPVDLVSEYRRINFDSLLQKAKEEGAQEALARDTKGKTQSTTPPKATGAPAGPVAKDGMNALNTLLAGYKP